MVITINGEKREFETPMTVSELLRFLDFKTRMVLVERNMEIVPRDAMDNTKIVDGDTIEILRLVGGG